MPQKKPTIATDASANSEKSIDDKIQSIIDKISTQRKREIFPLFQLSQESISPKVVDDVYSKLRKKFKTKPEELDVVIESSGGSIDAAYNIGLLLRRYAQKELTIIIPRWAKSAATVIAW
jgi:ClpP class serine protease